MPQPKRRRGTPRFLIHFVGYMGRIKTWEVIGEDIRDDALRLMESYGFEIIEVEDWG